MGLGKIITAGAISLAASTVAGEVRAEDGRHNHAVAAVEGSQHHVMVQGKYAKSIKGPLALGAAIGAGINTHKDLMTSGELLVALTTHVSKSIGVALEVSAGAEMTHGPQTHIEPTGKAALFGEYEIKPGLRAFAGPYVGRIGHENQIGGAAGFILDI